MNAIYNAMVPELGNYRSGKVRDIHVLGDGRRVMIASDRISCFDKVSKQPIPYKGAVLTSIANYWFENTKDIIGNHILDTPDPSVIIAKECKPIALEVIVRRFLTGSAWRDYEKGKREKSGVNLADGLTKNYRFDEPIITPSTKAEEGHDIDISVEDAASQCIVSKDFMDDICEKAVALFKRGEELSYKNGLILVDTKYEFGLDVNNELVLIDEVHTPDSSRYWLVESYEADNENPVQLNKEFVRQWLINEKDYMGEGDFPEMPVEVVDEVSKRYLELYNKVTGKSLDVESDASKRIIRNLKKSLGIKGCFVQIIAGSKSDDRQYNKIEEKLREYDIPHSTEIASAHKNPRKVLALIDELNKSIEPLVYITIAGRSNALSGMVAANSVHPVIACPPFKDMATYNVDVHSSLRMPSNVAVAVIIDPGNAALFAKRIFDM
ncbi:phosphoribosylaminoimidazolesuccinocarboxamide synthase [Candidatus Woesearchaeota archaeon]|nr:phosphoribosylaminoimidazolesuccinocarboxamide synthase [Candidatus Woesearchaeota archaeon]